LQQIAPARQPRRLVRCCPPLFRWISFGAV
jgi:hypothetical protein